MTTGNEQQTAKEEPFFNWVDFANFLFNQAEKKQDDYYHEFFFVIRSHFGLKPNKELFELLTNFLRFTILYRQRTHILYINGVKHEKWQDDSFVKKATEQYRTSFFKLLPILNFEGQDAKRIAGTLWEYSIDYEKRLNAA